MEIQAHHQPRHRRPPRDPLPPASPSAWRATIPGPAGLLPACCSQRPADDCGKTCHCLKPCKRRKPPHKRHRAILPLPLTRHCHGVTVSTQTHQRPPPPLVFHLKGTAAMQTAITSAIRRPRLPRPRRITFSDIGRTPTAPPTSRLKQAFRKCASGSRRQTFVTERQPRSRDGTAAWCTLCDTTLSLGTTRRRTPRDRWPS